MSGETDLTPVSAALRMAEFEAYVSLLGFDNLNFGHSKQPCKLSFVPTTHLEAYLCSHIDFSGSLLRPQSARQEDGCSDARWLQQC